MIDSPPAFTGTAALLLLLEAGSSCVGERIDRTTLEVRISTTLAVPSELDEVRVVARVLGPPERARAYQAVVLDNQRDLPLLVAFTPSRAATEAFDIEVNGYFDGEPVAFASSRLSGFVQDETRRLEVELTTACRSRETCMASPRLVDPNTLVRTSGPADGGPP